MKKIFSIICCTLIIFTTGCEYKNKNLDNKEQTNQKENIYKLNDTIVLDNGKGKMNLKFLSVTETNDRNEFEEIEYKKVIFIEYEYENIDLNDDYYIDNNNFKIYDKNNRILEMYPLDLKVAPAISKGRNATNKIAYGLNNDNNYIEIELRTSSGRNLNKKVILEW